MFITKVNKAMKTKWVKKQIVCSKPDEDPNKRQRRLQMEDGRMLNCNEAK